MKFFVLSDFDCLEIDFLLRYLNAAIWTLAEYLEIEYFGGLFGEGLLWDAWTRVMIAKFEIVGYAIFDCLDGDIYFIDSFLAGSEEGV